MLSKIVSPGFVSIVVDPGRNLLFSGSDNAFFLGFDVGKAQIYDFFPSSKTHDTAAARFSSWLPRRVRFLCEPET